MYLQWQTDTVEGIALVRLALVNDAPVPHRVRVANRLDGPVLPPRSGGVPEAGWDRDGYRGVVPAETAVALGYACPAPAADPPSELVDDVPVNRADEAEAEPTRSSPAAVARRLGDPTPPRDAVPGARPGADEPTPERRPGSPERSSVAPAGSGAVDGSDARDGRSLAVVTDDGGDDGDDARDAAATPVDAAPSRTDSVPPAVVEWLDGVEERVELAESLTAASVPTATAALERAGGLDAAESTVARVDADRRALRAVRARAAALAERAASTDVPVETLRRLS